MKENQEQFKVFETVEAVRKYAEGNYVENGEILTAKEPYWENNPFALEMRKEAGKIILKTYDITLTPSPNSLNKP